VCLEALPELDGVRISIGAVLNIWEGEDGGGGSVICIWVGVFRPYPVADSAPDRAATTEDVGSNSDVEFSLTVNGEFSMLGDDVVVGIVPLELGVGVHGVEVATEFTPLICVSTVGPIPFGSPRLSLL